MVELKPVAVALEAPGRRTTLKVDGQSPVAYTYDPASRLRTITQTSVLSPVTIDYDDLGRRTLLTLPNGVSTEYQYDPASRLTALIYRNAFGPLGDLTYEYDPAGNRTAVGGSFARTLLPDPILTSAYDAANQQLTFGDKTMTFDANGNLETITDPTGTTNFTWDVRNRLIAMNGPTVSAAFAYDVLNRRKLRTIDGVMTSYHYDSWQIVREIIDGVDISYLHGMNIDETLVRAEKHFLLTEGVGSVTGLTDSTGQLVTHYTYGPFGVTSISGLPIPNSFQFTGRENDAIGLYHYRLRYLIPALGRFITEDPLGILAGMNFYSYVDNNPLRYADPFGLQALNRVREFLNNLNETRGGRALRGGVLFYLSYLVDRSIESLPCGEARGALNLLSAALSFSGGVEYSIITISAIGFAILVPDVTLTVKMTSGAVGVVTGAIAVVAFQASVESASQGLSELFTSVTMECKP